MSEDQIKVAEDSGIVTITLNRPERLNAFFGHMRRDLAEALEEAGSDPDVRAVVITGAGRAFCAGGDVNFMAELVERNDAEEFARLLGAARRVILGIRHMTKPVIASINGPASGAGFNLALACDLRIASSEATFTQSFVNLVFIRIGVEHIFFHACCRRTSPVNYFFSETRSMRTRPCG